MTLPGQKNPKTLKDTEKGRLKSAKINSGPHTRFHISSARLTVAKHICDLPAGLLLRLARAAPGV